MNDIEIVVRHVGITVGIDGGSGSGKPRHGCHQLLGQRVVALYGQHLPLPQYGEGCQRGRGDVHAQKVLRLVQHGYHAVADVAGSVILLCAAGYRIIVQYRPAGGIHEGRDVSSGL